MEATWPANACPFPPGEPKPDAMEAAPRRRQPRALLGRRLLTLALALIALVSLYVYRSPAMSPNAKPLLYQENFAIRLSLYTYASVMLTHFIRRYRGRSRENK